MSTGKFLCFCDADDISLPKRLEKQYALCKLQKNPYNCIVGSKFERFPKVSTKRYSNWANSLTNEQLYTQVINKIKCVLLLDRILKIYFFS